MIPHRLTALLICFCACTATPTTGQTAQPAASASDMLRLVKENFPIWDKDQDGTLTFDEIEVAAHDPNVRTVESMLVAVLRNRAVLRGKTLAEYESLLTERKKGETVNEHERAFAAAINKYAETNQSIFANGLPGSKLAQGKLGDCFLLVSVGTMAQTNPERLKSLVETLPDDKVAVNFGDGERVVIDAPTPAEIVIGSTTRGDGVWGNVFEKAIGQRYLARQKEQRHLTPYSIIGKGGTPNVPMSMLTGGKSKREGCEMFQKPGLDDIRKEARLEEIRVALEAAFRDKRLVVGGTGPLKGTGTVVKGLYYNHSYGVLAYDRETDTVTFWNPMSNGFTPKGPEGLEYGYKTNFGVFKCPLREAVMWFGSFSIEQDEKIDWSAR